MVLLNIGLVDNLGQREYLIFSRFPKVNVRNLVRVNFPFYVVLKFLSKSFHFLELLFEVR